jgi:hypothetical protein
MGERITWYLLDAIGFGVKCIVTLAAFVVNAVAFLAFWAFGIGDLISRLRRRDEYR